MCKLKRWHEPPKPKQAMQERMKIFIRGAAAAAVLSLLGVSEAAAQTRIEAPMPTTWATGISCLDGFDATLFAFAQCSGSWSGNDHGMARPAQSLVDDYVDDVWGVGTSGVSYSGGPLLGDFVLAVKGGRAFSLFYFEDHDGSSLDLQRAMWGVAVNGSGKAARDVSHATVYGGRTTSVPEPTNLFLIGTGMLAMGILLRRRREEAFV